jgi:uncharacterized protein (DUF1778 family)
MTSIRVSDEDLAEIDRRAAAAGVSRTQYIIDRALGRLPGTELEEQLDDLRERIETLESPRRRSRRKVDPPA